MPRTAPLLALLAGLGLSACAVATPFRGPGYDPASGPTIGGARLVVAVTNARLGTERGVFWENVARVEASLADRPGFVGHSKRTPILGGEAWTLSVWTDEAALDAFVASETHQRAIAEAYPGLAGTRFHRFELDRAAVPPSWEEALARLEAEGRSYD